MVMNAPERIIVIFESSVVVQIDSLVKKSRYSNRSEFIRAAVREKLDRESGEGLD